MFEFLDDVLSDGMIDALPVNPNDTLDSFLGPEPAYPDSFELDGEVCPVIPRELEPDIHADWDRAAGAAGVEAPHAICYRKGCPGAVCVGDPSDPSDDIGVIDPEIYHATRATHGADAYVPIFGHECGHQLGALTGRHVGSPTPTHELDADTMASIVASKTGSTMRGFNTILKGSQADGVHPNGALRVFRTDLQGAAIDADPFRELIPPERNPFLAERFNEIDRIFGA